MNTQNNNDVYENLLHIKNQETKERNIKNFNDKDLPVNKKQLACVITYGCQQNKSDSEKIKGVLSSIGYEFSEDLNKVELVIFNTCAVRENAETRTYGNIGFLKNIKKKNPRMLIGICGCMSEQKRVQELIKKKYKHVDFVVGTNAAHKIPEIIKKSKNAKVFENYEKTKIIENIPKIRNTFPTASVAIMEGCDNFCTYCMVPHVRGRERSRRAECIISEVAELSRKGYKEVTLLGQNVNSYGKNLNRNITFAKLLGRICKIEGIERIRFISSHPKDVSDELIEVIAHNPKICKQFHLPIQSGSNKVLENMNRNYTRESYLNLVSKLKQKIPNISLTTDIIVGFPSETNEDFEDTIDVLKKVEYDMIFSFLYSKRYGTKAYEMKECMPLNEIQKNFNRLLEVQNEISKQKNETFVDKHIEVLVEGTSKNNPIMMFGRSDGGKIVNFCGAKELVGKIIKLKIIKAKTWYLVGEMFDYN